MSAQQFEHDGFNSPNEVEAASKARFDIRARPGCIGPETMRTLFEQCVTETPAFRENFPLDRAFGGYIDPETDRMWVGFAVGMRCAERIARATGSTS